VQLCVAVGLLQVLRPVPAPKAADPERELVARCGHNPVCCLALSGPTSYFWSGDDGCVAYAVRGRSAIALGDPIACGDRVALAAAGFLAFCDRQDWTGSFYQVEAAQP
jgi:phosphatidylglycerol lysyltransferase